MRIEVKDVLKPFDWDGEDVLLTAEQVREAIEAMGKLEERINIPKPQPMPIEKVMKILRGE